MIGRELGHFRLTESIGAGGCVVAGRSARWSHEGRRVFFTRRGRPLDDPALKSEEA
jgi:hypothetical protein